ncbi:MAG: M28 family metallopeptidase [Candidatus Eisenbacteria bacterium]|nr:M28 family metallopeptidase [Candidatus Eisenbacteria bacterium]
MRRLIFALAAAAFAARLLTPSPRPAHAASLPPIAGFRAADADAERSREAQVAATIRPDTLRRNLRVLTETPHVAGTPADRATAEYVLARLKGWGWNAHLESVPVYLNYPAESKLELIEPQSGPLSTREKGAAWDKDAHDAAAFDGFHGYGAAGEVTAQVIYANYGDVDDIQKLSELGLDPHGKILLVRYGKIFRGLKVRNAERAGAAAVIIYSDPADDGYAKADPYPRGPARPEDSIQRGSVQYLSEGPGDPTTPGWPSREGGRRLKPAEARGIPRIPSLPLSWGEARKILTSLEGPQSPAAWQGGLPLTYHLGPGPAKLHMKVGQDYAVRPIWNVIASLRGRELPDQWVICGNHRDAWTYGAVDPNSGTICMLEMARGICDLMKTGWRPRRTLMLCSWDGEEYGLLGSTEFAEEHAADLTANAVAYLNVDVAVAGHDFRVNGAQALADVIVGAMADVPDPSRAGSVFGVARDRAFADGKTEWARRNRERRWRGEPERPFSFTMPSLGSGSDYTAFEDHLGIASADLRFEGLQGTYHSIYDDFEYLDRVVDPGYAYHATMTDLWSRVALRLAEAEVMPLHFSATAVFALDELQGIGERADDASAGAADSLVLKADLAPAKAAATRLRDRAIAVETEVAISLAEGTLAPERAAAVNAALLGTERALLGDGLPGRAWFGNEIYAPGLNTGYAPVPLPRLGQAVLDKSRAAYAGGAAPIEAALDRAAAAFAKLMTK